MDNEITHHLLEQILSELRQMRREQTDLIRLWMQQDKDYHEKAIGRIEGVE